MSQLLSMGYIGMTAAIIGVIVLSYYWYQDHSTEMFTRHQEKKKGYTEAELEQFLSPEVDQHVYDASAMGLEQSIVDSHKQFTDEAYKYAHGANSTDVIRDDTNEVNRRWGLRRIDYESAYSGEDSRTVSSEDPSQVQQKHDSFVL
jgi:hypothetical protein